jgi:hypothetical protein
VRRLVLTNTQETPVPQLAVHGPFNECDLNHGLAPNPMRTDAGQADRFRERALSDFDLV